MHRFTYTVVRWFVLVPLILQANHFCRGTVWDQNNSCEYIQKLNFHHWREVFGLGDGLRGWHTHHAQVGLLVASVHLAQFGVWTQVHLWVMFCNHTLGHFHWGEHFLKATNLNPSATQAKFFLLLTFWMKYIDNRPKRSHPFLKGLQRFPWQRALPWWYLMLRSVGVSGSCCEGQRQTGGWAGSPGSEQWPGHCASLGSVPLSATPVSQEATTGDHFQGSSQKGRWAFLRF